MKQSLINSIIIGAMFSSIALLSTYWAKGSITGKNDWPYIEQFFTLWALCSVLIFIVDRIFPKN